MFNVDVDVKKISLVYDADKGVWGHVVYAFGMLRGEHCPLCDISHAGVRRKAAFDELTCSLSVPVEVLYRNTQGPELAAFTEEMGAVAVAHTDEGLHVLLGDAELESLGGDVDRFAEALAAKLAAIEVAS